MRGWSGGGRDIIFSLYTAYVLVLFLFSFFSFLKYRPVDNIIEAMVTKYNGMGYNCIENMKVQGIIVNATSHPPSYAFLGLPTLLGTCPSPSLAFRFFEAFSIGPLPVAPPTPAGLPGGGLEALLVPMGSLGTGVYL